MKTPDEIKKGLKCCNTFNDCQQCPYDNDDEGWFCTVERNADALAYIEQLEANQHKWIAPKDKMPDVPVFIGISKFNPDAQIYRKNLIDPDYTNAWLNIKNDILWWMPVPDVPKEV